MNKIGRSVVEDKDEAGPIDEAAPMFASGNSEKKNSNESNYGKEEGIKNNESLVCTCVIRNKLIEKKKGNLEEGKKKTLKPRDYQEKIFEEAKKQNSIIFMETGRGKTLVGILLLKEALKKFKPTMTRKKPKGLFLVCDSSLITQQIRAIENDTDFKVNSLQGKKGKKSKSDYNEFRDLYDQTDIFVAIPDVLYKLLIIGFIKIYEIDIIVFDECHHCDSNHTYNLIMTEFYFFYKDSPDVKLPQIVGLTASPLKKKIGKNIEKAAITAMVNLCENLDSVMIIDPDMKMDNKTFDNSVEYSDGKDYIETQSYMKAQNFQILYNKISELLLKPMVHFCVKRYNETAEITPYESDDIFIERYMNFIEQKFLSGSFQGFSKAINKNMDLYSLTSSSILFRIFEKIQRNVFMLIESMNLFSLIRFFTEYSKIYHSKISNSNKNKNFDINQELIPMCKEIEQLSFDEIKKLHEIFSHCDSSLRNEVSKINFESDRLIQLEKKLEEVLKEDPKSKIIIFVSNRIVANSLEEVLNIFLKKLKNSLENCDGNLECTSVIGINKKKTENSSVFDPKNSISELNEKLDKFNKGEYNILIGTSTVEEGLDIQSCNIVMVFTELNTAKSYVQMKGRARKENAKFLAFTESKVETIQKIKDFIMLSECMKNLFVVGIKQDFRGKNVIERKKLSINEGFIYIKKTEAKVTLKCVNKLFNDVIQNMGNLQIPIKINKNFKEILINKQKYFLCHLILQSKVFPDKELAFKSEECSDKQSSENECYLKFMKYLVDKKIVDGHFKVKQEAKLLFEKLGKV